MARGKVDNVSLDSLTDGNAASEMKKLALSVNPKEKDNYIETLRNLSREQLAGLLKANFFEETGKQFKRYSKITKSYVYYGLLEMVLDKLGFDIRVTGTGGRALKQQIIAFERMYRLKVDSGLAGRQVLTTMYGLMEWYGAKPRTNMPVQANIFNAGFTNEIVAVSQKESLAVDKRFYRNPGGLESYLNSPAYQPAGKPKIFHVGVRPGLQLSEIRTRNNIIFHGSEGYQAGGITMGYRKGEFHYLILPRGDIAYFGDDRRGHGALGGYPTLFGDPLAQAHSIAVEFCCPPVRKKVNGRRINETLPPNARMVEAANYLRDHLEKKYKKTLNVGISIDGYAASPTKHTDTLTWPEETLRSFGVSEESISRRESLLKDRFGVNNPSSIA